MDFSLLLPHLDTEISDADEETFLLFAQSFPSQDLGFVDPKSHTIDLDIHDYSLSITQSPTLLSSNRNDGTTGAVVWRVTPLFAEWLSSNNNILFDSKILRPDATVLELGCGSSGIVALTVGPRVGTFIATDQEYVFKLLRHNLEANTPTTKAESKPKRAGRAGGSSTKNEPRSNLRNVHVLALDWEKSSVSSLPHVLPGGDGCDVIVACDCIYNEALIAPLVGTCVEICRLREARDRPTVCIIAQQLRSDLVFTSWLSAFHKTFRVWRIPDKVCGDALSSNKGFAIHIGILRSSLNGGTETAETC